MGLPTNKRNYFFKSHTHEQIDIIQTESGDELIHFATFSPMHPLLRRIEQHFPGFQASYTTKLLNEFQSKQLLPAKNVSNMWKPANPSNKFGSSTKSRKRKYSELSDQFTTQCQLETPMKRYKSSHQMPP